MTIGTLCSGIGGIDLGFEAAGFECKFVVEIDKSCQNVLRRHFPKALMLSDMTECGAHNLPKVNVLAGGTPCQGFSVAGLRGSLADDRSNLCLQFVRIANELDPGILVWENVVGCLSTKDNAFGCFLAALVGADAPLVPPRTIQRWNADKDGNEYFSWPNAGVVAGPKRTAAWRVLDSQYFGVAQRRERVFVIADTLGGCSPQILFESEGVRRHSAPSREVGQSPAGTLSARTEGGGGLGTDFELGGGLVPAFEPIPVQEIGKRQSGNPMNGVGYGKPGDPMFTLQAAAQHGVCCAKPLVAGNGHSGISDGIPSNIIAGTVSSKWPKGTGGPSGDECQNLVAFSGRSRGDDGRGYDRPPHVTGDIIGALETVKPWNVSSRTMVRRLTPIECARLQAHPDDWAVWGVNANNVVIQQSDSQQYRQYGNGVTATVLEWIAKRVAKHLP